MNKILLENLVKEIVLEVLKEAENDNEELKPIDKIVLKTSKMLNGMVTDLVKTSSEVLNKLNSFADEFQKTKSWFETYIQGKVHLSDINKSVFLHKGKEGELPTQYDIEEKELLGRLIIEFGKLAKSWLSVSKPLLNLFNPVLKVYSDPFYLKFGGIANLDFNMNLQESEESINEFNESVKDLHSDLLSSLRSLVSQKDFDIETYKRILGSILSDKDFLQNLEDAIKLLSFQFEKLVKGLLNLKITVENFGSHYENGKFIGYKMKISDEYMLIQYFDNIPYKEILFIYRSFIKGLYGMGSGKDSLTVPSINQTSYNTFLTRKEDLFTLAALI